MSVQLEFLKRIPYFDDLGLAELDSIKRLIFGKEVERGETVLLEGESSEALYFIISGMVKMFKTSAEGKEQILSIARPGETLNDVAVFDGGPNPTSAHTMTPVTLYGIKRSNLEFILHEYPTVALNVVKVLAGRVRHLVSLVEDLSFRHVIGRVANILLQHAGDRTGTRPRLTQQEMAAMAGTVREVVSRSLKTLEERGMIKLDRHRIVITNKEALEDMVGIPS